MEDRNIKTYYSNFKRSNKWLGIVDYKLACIAVIYFFLLVKILTFLKLNLEVSVTLFSIFMVPVIALILVCYKEDNAPQILFFMLKYTLNRNIYTNLKAVKKFTPEIYKINIVKSKKK